mmetsp:Transcript_30352/g.59439  ORF Transcript_30352/g.59439 Transcript_30352/m.59439 type:complete len:252 (-) Transcript_30352:870-1625(-)
MGLPLISAASSFSSSLSRTASSCCFSLSSSSFIVFSMYMRLNSGSATKCMSRTVSRVNPVGSLRDLLRSLSHSSSANVSRPSDLYLLIQSSGTTRKGGVRNLVWSRWLYIQTRTRRSLKYPANPLPSSATKAFPSFWSLEVLSSRSRSEIIVAYEALAYVWSLSTSLVRSIRSSLTAHFGMVIFRSERTRWFREYNTNRYRANASNSTTRQIMKGARARRVPVMLKKGMLASSIISWVIVPLVRGTRSPLG